MLIKIGQYIGQAPQLKMKYISNFFLIKKYQIFYFKVNHFPNSFHITRKDLMNKCISKMQDKYGGSHFNFLPKTYILPQ